MLTRHGWAATVAAAASFAAGRVFGLIELYVLGGGLCAAIAAALVTVRLPMPALATARRLDPPLVGVGDPLRVELQVRNVGRLRSPSLRLWEPVGAEGGALMQVAPLRSGAAATAAYRVPTTRRGVVELGPVSAERHDALALARRLVEAPGTAAAVVVPARIAVAMPQPGRGGPLSQHLGARALGRAGADFHSQREYAPGDDPRRINWKASARTDDLIVTERESERLRRCTVALDVSDPGFGSSDDDGGDGFERAVSIAASLVEAADVAGVAVRLVTPGVDVRGHGVTADALRGLATVEPAPTTIDPRVLSGAEDGLGIVVIVCATPAAGRALTASMSIAPDDTILVVHSGTGPDADGVVDAVTTRSGAEWSLAAPSLASFAAAWQRLVEAPS